MANLIYNTIIKICQKVIFQKEINDNVNWLYEEHTNVVKEQEIFFNKLEQAKEDINLFNNQANNDKSNFIRTRQNLKRSKLKNDTEFKKYDKSDKITEEQFKLKEWKIDCIKKKHGTLKLNVQNKDYIYLCSTKVQKKNLRSLKQDLRE